MNEQSTHKDTERHAREWRDEFSSGGDRIGEQGNEAGYPGTVPAEDRRAESAPDSASGHLSEGISGDVSHDGHPAAETPDNPEQEPAPVTSATLSPESFSDVPPDMAGGNASGEEPQPGAAHAETENGTSGGEMSKKIGKISAAARVEPGIAEKCFNGLSWAGLPVLLVMTALVVFQQLLAPRALWLFDEVRAADVYMRFLGGDQLALSLNGVPCTDMPPLYFWFLRGLDLVPHVDQPLLFFLGTALSAMLYIGAIWLLARATGHDRRTAFASGLLALTTFFIMGLAQSPNADLLFAATVVLSLICFYRGWIRTKAPVWLTLAFLLAGAATLIKGPLALAFPIIASILFLFWRGTPGRLNGRDGLPGFLLMLLLIGVWLVMLYVAGHTDYIVDMFQRQLAGRIFDTGENTLPRWFYLAALPLVCLPWTLLPLFVNWWGAARGVPAAWRSRRENGGSSWLWLTLLAGLALLSALGAKSATALLPLLAPLAVLAGRSLLRLTPRRSRLYFFFTACMFLLLGLLLVAGHYHARLLPLLPAAWIARLGELPPLVFAWLDAARNLVCMGGVLIILALLLIFLCRRSLPGGALLLCSAGLVVMNLPFARNVAPSLEGILSPRPHASAMAPLAHEGYKPAAYRVSPGAFAYYLNECMAAYGTPETGGRPAFTVPEFDSMDQLRELLAKNDRVLVVMPEKDWNDWQDRPARLTVIGRQWMVDEPCVLVKQDERPAEDGTAGEPTPPMSVPADAPLSDGRPAAAASESGSATADPTAPPEHAGEERGAAPALPPEDAPAAAVISSPPSTVIPPDKTSDMAHETPASSAENDAAQARESEPMPELPGSMSDAAEEHAAQ